MIFVAEKHKRKERYLLEVRGGAEDKTACLRAFLAALRRKER